MTARVRPISTAVNAGQYFYFTERNYECSKGWQQNEVTKELGLEKITRESFENVLSGKIKDGVHLGRMTQDGLKHHPGQEITFTAPSGPITAISAVGQAKLRSDLNSFEFITIYAPPYALRVITVILGTLASLKA